MNIDWSKAPKGFDWYFQPKRSTGPDDLGGFYGIGPSQDRFSSESGSYILFKDLPSVPEMFIVASRPTPTERDKTIEDLTRVIDEAFKRDVKFAQAVYDAGYRKFEIVEEDV